MGQTFSAPSTCMKTSVNYETSGHNLKDVNFKDGVGSGGINE